MAGMSRLFYGQRALPTTVAKAVITKLQSKEICVLHKNESKSESRKK
jgi:hypothetical protein